MHLSLSPLFTAAFVEVSFTVAIWSKCCRSQSEDMVAMLVPIRLFSIRIERTISAGVVMAITGEAPELHPTLSLLRYLTTE